MHTRLFISSGELPDTDSSLWLDLRYHVWVGWHLSILLAGTDNAAGEGWSCHQLVAVSLLSNLSCSNCYIEIIQWGTFCITIQEPTKFCGCDYCTLVAHEFPRLLVTQTSQLSAYFIGTQHLIWCIVIKNKSITYFNLTGTSSSRLCMKSDFTEETRISENRCILIKQKPSKWHLFNTVDYFTSSYIDTILLWTFIGISAVVVSVDLGRGS